MSLTSQNVFDLASTMRVLTLATFFGQDVWTAPVYYVFSNKKCYFFSNPDSKHIKYAQDTNNSEASNNLKVTSNLVAASLFLDDTNFKKIKGLQMQGQILKVENKKDAFLRAMEYIKKFKINYNKEDILEFFYKKYKAQLYEFIPEIVYYMDNSMKLGSRERLEL